MMLLLLLVLREQLKECEFCKYYMHVMYNKFDTLEWQMNGDMPNNRVGDANNTFFLKR